MRILSKIKEIGFSSVNIKVVDDSVNYNLTPNAFHTQWTDDILPKLMKEFVDLKMPALGWGYTYLINPEREAEAVASRIHQLNLQGYAIDAEIEAKKAPEGSARRYIRRLRTLCPDVPLALNSYRYPSLHNDFPWMEFLENMDVGDVHMPQVYWLGDSRPNGSGEQLKRSFDELKKLKDLPVIPEGSIWAQNVNGEAWASTPAQIKCMAETAWELGCEGVTWWVWDQIQKDKTRSASWWSSLKWVSENWQGEIMPPVPPPNPLDIETRLKNIEERLAALEDELNESRSDR